MKKKTLPMPNEINGYAHINEYFKAHPDATVFHFTSDGFAFHEDGEHLANGHAALLADKSVKTVKRSDLEAMKAAEEKAAANEADTNNEGGEGADGADNATTETKKKNPPKKNNAKKDAGKDNTDNGVGEGENGGENTGAEDTK